MKKMLIFGILGLVLAAGAYFGYMKFFPKGGDQPPAAEGGENPSEWQAEVAKTPPPANPPPQQPQLPNNPEEDEDDGGVKLAANFSTVLNLPSQPGAKSTFFKVTVSIIVADEELGTAMKSATPTFESEKSRAIIREALTELSADEIDQPETQMVFAQDIKDKLNDQFRPRPSTDKGKEEKKGKEKEKEKGKDTPRPMRPIKEVLIIEWQFQR